MDRCGEGLGSGVRVLFRASLWPSPTQIKSMYVMSVPICAGNQLPIMHYQYLANLCLWPLLGIF